MGSKKVCMDCRVTLNRILTFDSDVTGTCPHCGKPMLLLPHRFRPPRKSDDKSWEVVAFLIDNGFVFQHIYREGVKEYYQSNDNNYVPYPTNMRDAKDFVVKYNNQAIKSKV